MLIKKNYIKIIFIITISIISLLLFAGSCKNRGLSNNAQIPEVSTNVPQRNNTVESSKPELNAAVGLQTTLRNIAKSITPAVVNIRAERIVQEQPGFRDFFHFFQRRMPEQRRGQSVGSGFIINNNGYIITNAHVVKSATKITIVLQDEREFEATLIGSDEPTDIAVLKINPSGRDLSAAPLGNSDDINVGDFAIAIGNPFGLRGTVTFGIISATGRSDISDQHATLKNFIQTDVSINRGNSGGPLLNIQGQVIGVNSMIYSPSGGNIGIGFAIPINIVKRVVNQLIKTGKVERGFIGALIQPMNSATAKHFGLETNRGVIVSSVQRGGPADKAGLQSGDVILEVNGQQIKDFAMLKRVISDVIPGAKVRMKILRQNETKDIELVVGRVNEQQANVERYYEGGRSEQESEPQTPGTPSSWMGMNFSSSSGDLTPHDESDEENGFFKRRSPGQQRPSVRGVVVQNVQSNSPADIGEIKQGDVIISINGKRISNISEMNNFIKISLKIKSFYIQIKRGNRIFFTTITR